MNKDKKYGIALCVLFFLSGKISVAQSDNRVRSAGAEYQEMEQVAANHEKVYVQLDRMVYTTGSTVRFRAFLVDAGLLPGGVGSKVLYLELDGPQMKSPYLWRANVHNGSCAGSFVLPYGMNGGMYSVRAFTSWMKNGKPDYIFSTDILVIEISENLPEMLPVYRVPVNGEGIISFYPESGKWVNGIASTTAYRLNFRVSGMLPDTIQVVENDSLIAAEIITAEAGFGSFDFLPDIRKSYHARLVYPGEQVTVTPVPDIEAYGYTLHAVEGEGGLMVTVNAQPEEGMAPSSLRLVAATNGTVLHDADLAAFAGERRVLVPVSEPHRGIVNLTLYDSHRFLLCQGLYYYDAVKEPEIWIEGLEPGYMNGEMVEMEVHVTGLEEGDSLSMAVSVSEQSPFNDILRSPDIDGYFNLYSEISNASWIYSETWERDKQQLQNLLLCLDPDDYAWNYYAGSRMADCTFDLEKYGFILRGRVLGKADNEPLANAHIMINLADSASVRIMYARTDTSGSFYAVLGPEYDQKEVILQILDPGDAEVDWELESKNLPVAERGTSEYPLSVREQDYIEQTMYLQIIDEVYENDHNPVAQPGNEEDVLPFLTPNVVISPGDYEAMNSFREIADNLLPAVRFATRNQQFRVSIYDRSEELWLESDWVFLNGVLFRDLAYIATLGSNDIDRIEIQNTKILMGKVTLQGFLSIYTVDGQIPDSYLEERTCVFRNEVLHEENTIQMAMPNSIPEADAMTSPAYPDLRQTLLWAPDVRVSGKDTLTLSFHTSQLDGLYEINIQGITRSGIPLHENLFFIVQ